MSEDQELLSRISQLAGQINLHKGRQQHNSSPVFGSRSSFTGNRSYRGPYYGSTRGHAGKHSLRSGAFRNRSLILKGQENAVSRENSDDPTSAEQSDDGPHDRWVTKRDRHLQLINTAHYETLPKNKTDTNTPKQETDHNEDNDAVVIKTANIGQQRQGKHDANITSRLYIDGIAFQVTEGGSKLVREKDDTGHNNATPESAFVGGVEFRRDHNGDLRRLHQGNLRKPCKRFSNTGECGLGPRCAYVHDPSKVAVCREYLRLGSCKDGEQCNLSHDCAYERVPACSHFQRGKCTKIDCRYAHIRVNPTAPVCRDFSALGYCALGSACSERHVFECPDYSSSGTCPNPNCRLPHIDRASQLRQHEIHLDGQRPAREGQATDQSIKIDVDSSSENDLERPNSSYQDAMDHVVLEGDPNSDQALDGEHNFIQL